MSTIVNIVECKESTQFPVASLLPVVCVTSTPVFYEKYIKRDLVRENILNDLNFNLTPTPTPTVTPTPSVTSTSRIKNNYSVVPAPTKSCTPTLTPTPTNSHKYRFYLQFQFSVYTELVIYFSLIKKSFVLYHAIEGNWPLNPISVSWRTENLNGLIVASDSKEINIPWSLTAAAADIHYPNVFTNSSSPTNINVGDILTGDQGTAENTINYNLRKYPQFSPQYVLDGSIIPLSSKFKIVRGSIPSNIINGGIFLDTIPNINNNYVAVITLADRTYDTSATIEPWSFTVVVES